jgi:hypothetical protein
MMLSARCTRRQRPSKKVSRARNRLHARLPNYDLDPPRYLDACFLCSLYNYASWYQLYSPSTLIMYDLVCLYFTVTTRCLFVVAKSD